MANLNLTFIDPSTNSEIDVECSDEMTGSEIVAALIDANFIHALEDNSHYALFVRGKHSIIPELQKLVDAGVQNGDGILVHPG